jgi:hypothetical protein
VHIVPLNSEKHRKFKKHGEKIFSKKIFSILALNIAFITSAQTVSMTAITEKSLCISFDIAKRDGKITDPQGNMIPSINSFGVTLYAFHSDTKVYKGK